MNTDFSDLSTQQAIRMIAQLAITAPQDPAWPINAQTAKIAQPSPHLAASPQEPSTSESLNPYHGQCVGRRDRQGTLQASQTITDKISQLKILLSEINNELQNDKLCQLLSDHEKKELALRSIDISRQLNTLQAEAQAPAQNETPNASNNHDEDDDITIISESDSNEFNFENVAIISNIEISPQNQASETERTKDEWQYLLQQIDKIYSKNKISKELLVSRNNLALKLNIYTTSQEELNTIFNKIIELLQESQIATDDLLAINTVQINDAKITDEMAYQLSQFSFQTNTTQDISTIPVTEQTQSSPCDITLFDPFTPELEIQTQQNETTKINEDATVSENEDENKMTQEEYKNKIEQRRQELIEQNHAETIRLSTFMNQVESFKIKVDAVVDTQCTSNKDITQLITELSNAKIEAIELKKYEPLPWNIKDDLDRFIKKIDRRIENLKTEQVKKFNNLYLSLSHIKLQMNDNIISTSLQLNQLLSDIKEFENNHLASGTKTPLAELNIKHKVEILSKNINDGILNGKYPLNTAVKNKINKLEAELTKLYQIKLVSIDEIPTMLKCIEDLTQNISEIENDNDLLEHQKLLISELETKVANFHLEVLEKAMLLNSLKKDKKECIVS